jgi:hypothetical protein
LRLNDIAEMYPSDHVKYFIISDNSNKEKFFRELDRPSFYLLRKYDCEFLTIEEVDEEWKEIRDRRPARF